MSDDDRLSPTTPDHARPSPSLSATRSETHTLTTREVLKIFEESGLPRNQRSIERYCKDDKLDCFFDPDEMRYYVTRVSSERLIGHLKEIQARHQETSMTTSQQSGPTATDNVRPPTMASDTDLSMKQDTDEKRHHVFTGEYERTVKELQDENFNLKVAKQAAEQMNTMLRDQIKEDRQEFSRKLVVYSRRVGQLETTMKQLAPGKSAVFGHLPPEEDAALEAEFTDNPDENFASPDSVKIITHQP